MRCINAFDLIPPTPFSILEKGEQTCFWMVLSPLSVWERGFRGEVVNTIKN
jgi:hypothetical protein